MKNNQKICLHRVTLVAFSMPTMASLKWAAVVRGRKAWLSLAACIVGTTMNWHKRQTG